MNAYEEELQRKIEARERIESDNSDVKAYQKVFNALGKEPEYSLSPSFADRIVQRVSERKSELSWDFFWFGFGIFCLIAGLVASALISIAYFGFKPDLGFLKSMADYKGLLLVAVILVSIFNYVEKRLIPHQKTIV